MSLFGTLRTICLVVATLGLFSYIFYSYSASIVIAPSFDEFKTISNRVFKDEAEEQMRRDIFKDTVARVRAHNENSNRTYNQTFTRFSDWTEQEKSALKSPMMNVEIPQPASNNSAAIESNFAVDRELRSIQDSFDWRSRNVLTPVKTQPDTGASWAYAAISIIESAYAITTGKLVEFSEDYLLDCMPEAYKKNYSIHYPLAFISEQGAIPRGYYTRGSCWDIPRVSGHPASMPIFVGHSESQMASALQQHGLQFTKIKLTDSLLQYSNGIYDSDDCKTDKVDETDFYVTVVGMGVDSKGQEYWTIRSTFGPDFGENGYIRIAKGKNACGIGLYSSYMDEILSIVP